jgi:adenosine deaminase
LRGRIVVAAVVVVALIIGARLALVARDFDSIAAADAFEAARGNHTDLRAFLQRMPKGGDLHTHLSGAVYAERFVGWAAEKQAQGEMCASLADVLVAKPHCDPPADVSVADALRDQKLYDRLVDAFSIRAFLRSAAEPTGHDQFFAAFEKFGAASGAHFVDMTVDQLRHYDSENVQYAEFMTSFSCSSDREKFVKAVAGQKDDAARLAALQASGLEDCVTAKRKELAAAIGEIARKLACDAGGKQPGCGVTFRYIAQVLRNNPPDDVFVQTAIAAALARTEPNVVALNLVQPEDYLVARRDYTRQMEIIGFLAKDVPVTLHAGELWLGLVPPSDLAFHIRQAVEIAHARRIGHGVALAFEDDMEGLLAEMRGRPVAVEINLTSNDVVLGVRGKDHPLPRYLAAGVPVVLSTDDAGISRINLSNEYFRAARDYALSYRTLKAFAHNALTYSFLDEGRKRAELERLDRSYAAFERDLTNRRSALQNLLSLMKATLTPPL